jgi:hypothetical protein
MVKMPRAFLLFCSRRLTTQLLLLPFGGSPCQPRKLHGPKLGASCRLSHHLVLVPKRLDDTRLSHRRSPYHNQRQQFGGKGRWFRRVLGWTKRVATVQVKETAGQYPHLDMAVDACNDIGWTHSQLYSCIQLHHDWGVLLPCSFLRKTTIPVFGRRDPRRRRTVRGRQRRGRGFRGCRRVQIALFERMTQHLSFVPCFRHVGSGPLRLEGHHDDILCFEKHSIAFVQTFQKTSVRRQKDLLHQKYFSSSDVRRLDVTYMYVCFSRCLLSELVSGRHVSKATYT